MVGSVLAPGQIFMMINSSMNVVFKISTNEALLWHGIPILLFVICCFALDSKLQIMIAKLMTVVYCCIMMAVLVSLFIQVSS